MSRTPLRCFCLLAALAGWGCGRDDKQMPVHGRVFYRGRPLPGGTIVFAPDVERGGSGPVAYGEIDAEGRYSLHSGEQLGVVPGWHRITIAPPHPTLSPFGGTGKAEGTPEQTVRPPIVDLPRKYSDPQQSGLLRQVEAGKGVEQDFHLE